MKKTEEYICPRCGADTEITCEDWENDGESASWTYHCPHCGADWTEYFNLTYIGYAMDDIDYDEKGDKINA